MMMKDNKELTQFDMGEFIYFDEFGGNNLSQ